jgi:hypothetical protein
MEGAVGRQVQHDHLQQLGVLRRQQMIRRRQRLGRVGSDGSCASRDTEMVATSEARMKGAWDPHTASRWGPLRLGFGYVRGVTCGSLAANHLQGTTCTRTLARADGSSTSTACDTWLHSRSPPAVAATSAVCTVRTCSSRDMCMYQMQVASSYAARYTASYA